MVVRARLVNPAGNRVFMGTITEGADVHEALLATAKAFHVETGTFELLGGLHCVELSAYDFLKQERLTPLIIARAMEIVAGHGTISLLDNEPHVHLHLTLSYRNGSDIRVIGGHASKALAFAVEFTLTAYDGAPVHRAEESSTKLKLWDLPELKG